MGTRKLSFVLLLIMLGVLFAVQQGLAQRGCQTETGTIWDIYVDKEASGLKLYGTLAIYYEEVCSSEEGCCEGEGGLQKMFFALRLNKGGQTFFFSGYSGMPELPSELPATMCYADTATQKEILFAFFQHVLETVSPGSTSFALKAVDNVVDTAPPHFTIMDLTIAVQN